MKEKEFISNCIYCGKQPEVIHYEADMWYVQCDCGKFGPYDHFGCTRKIALERWNYSNRPMNRTPPPRKERKNAGKSKKKNTSNDL